MTNLYDLPGDILVTAEGGLRIITLNRPDDLNASTTKMLFTYPKLFRALVEDTDARVAILTGADRANWNWINATAESLKRTARHE